MLQHLLWIFEEFGKFNDCNVNHIQSQEEEGVLTVTPPNKDVSKSTQVKENSGSEGRISQCD